MPASKFIFLITVVSLHGNGNNINCSFFDKFFFVAENEFEII